MEKLGPNKKLLSLYVDEETKDFLRTQAKKEKRTMSAHASYILSKYREEVEGKNPSIRKRT